MKIQKTNFLFLFILLLSMQKFIFCQFSKQFENLDTIKFIPKVVKIKILANLSSDELLSKILVNKSWKEIIYDWRVWSQKAKNIIGFVTNFGDKPGETAGYTLSNLDEARKIYRILCKIKLDKENEEKVLNKEFTSYRKSKKEKNKIYELNKKLELIKSDIRNISLTIKNILKYFNSPEIILSNLDINLFNEDEDRFNLPNDLPLEGQAAWPGSSIEINWRDEWVLLDRKWKELETQNVISSADLNNQVFARLLIVAKAYINKMGEEINFDKIIGNDLFKAALKFLSSQEEKYENIRSSYERPSGRFASNDQISLRNKSITSKDLPFVCFFLNKINEQRSILFLDLSNNLIVTIPVGLFDGLKKLKSLNLSNNQIMEIPVGAFKFLEVLTDLNISNNQLVSLSDKIFSACKKIKYINISNNQLTNISGEIFNELKMLLLLDLSNNQLTDLPNRIFNGLYELRFLDISNNRLTKLNVELFKSLEGLNTLLLDENRFSALPENLDDIFTEMIHISVKNSELNNREIKIPIKTSSRESFKRRIYRHVGVFPEENQSAVEGEDYIFVDPDSNS